MSRTGIPVYLKGERDSDRKRCPHVETKYCPLYHAAHEPIGLGCDDGKLGDHDGCAVDRGALKYAQAYAILNINHPRIVAECEWNEAKETRGRQIDRNMRTNGIH